MGGPEVVPEVPEGPFPLSSHPKEPGVVNWGGVTVGVCVSGREGNEVPRAGVGHPLRSLKGGGGGGGGTVGVP